MFNFDDYWQLNTGFPSKRDRQFRLLKVLFIMGWYSLFSVISINLLLRFCLPCVTLCQVLVCGSTCATWKCVWLLSVGISVPFLFYSVFNYFVYRLLFFFNLSVNYFLYVKLDFNFFNYFIHFIFVIQYREISHL